MKSGSGPKHNSGGQRKYERKYKNAVVRIELQDRHSGLHRKRRYDDTADQRPTRVGDREADAAGNEREHGRLRDQLANDTAPAFSQGQPGASSAVSFQRSGQQG